MHRPTDLLKRAKRTYQTEGLKSVVSRGFAFTLKQFFEHQHLRLWQYNVEDVRQIDEVDVMPGIGDFTFRIVTSNQEADELETDGYEFRSYPFYVNARKALDKHAVALCVFVGMELATIAWVATSQQAQDSLGEPPAKVSFSSNEVWIGGVWSNPKYRRMGLRKYRQFKMRRFLLDNGVVVNRGGISKGNIVASRGSVRTGEAVYAEGRYLKILWWKSWRERPLTPQQGEQIAKGHEQTD